MYFRQLTAAQPEGIEHIYQHYCKTFPADERRNDTQFKAMLQNGQTLVLSIESGRGMLGYCIGWPLRAGLFIEHFEIYEAFRSGGLGSTVLAELKKQYPVMILECEPATLSEIAHKRILFYERNGFQVVDTTYIQPAYDATKRPQPMYLMATQALTLGPVIDEIYGQVYQVNPPA
ncbi:GNAT family N-acetyltransferase [Emticicia sp. 17c]|uniref:GNAT family N-acetyltransferase n=1 Tax=Emticicia sp. 17c TaxID=3127704 RepID=UPI00301DA047